MGNHLCDGPVGVPEAGARESIRLQILITHCRSLDVYLELDVKCAMGPYVRRIEIRQRLRVRRTANPRSPKGLECLECHDPRRYRRGEIFGEKGSEWLIFP